MSKGATTLQAPAKFRWSWILRVVLWSLVILVFSALSSCTLLIETPVHFLIGWYFHAEKALPPLLAKWPAVFLPAGCLVLAGILIHRFVTRSLKEKGALIAWRPANTAAVLSLLLLGCGAAIALSGVLHQGVWLMGDPWIDNGRRIELTVAMNNARQLGLAFFEFHEKKGRYPNSFSELETELENPDKLIWLRSGYGDLREPFVILHPGSTRMFNGDEPLFVSPVIRSGGRIVVGYTDMSVRAFPAGQLERILQTREPEKPPPPTQ